MVKILEIKDIKKELQTVKKKDRLLLKEYFLTLTKTVSYKTM